MTFLVLGHTMHSNRPQHHAQTAIMTLELTAKFSLNYNIYYVYITLSILIVQCLYLCFNIRVYDSIFYLCFNIRVYDLISVFIFQYVFKQEQEEYVKEGIDWKEINFVDNQPLLVSVWL